MGLLSWIIVGLIAGFLASLVMRGGSSGILGDIILGIVGALIGGFLAGALFGVADPISGVDISTILVATLGAVVTIAIVRAITGRTPA
jgi:uncharacterized membrane protein YeaQ/YmgE (transglycosylase-associated protein family)